MKIKEYTIVHQNPVARFYYRGKSHSHPVRRTVLIIEDLPNYIVGYELREGSIRRSFTEALIKSYRKDKIARYGDYCRLRAKKRQATDSTLERVDLFALIKEGA